MCLVFDRTLFSLYNDDEIEYGLNAADDEIRDYSETLLDIEVLSYLGGSFPLFVSLCMERALVIAYRNYFLLLLEYDYRQSYY